MRATRFGQVVMVLAAMAALYAAPAVANGSTTISAPTPVSAATIVTTARRVVVSIPDRKLAVIDETGAVDVYDIAVGAPATPSPVGTFTIVNRITHPTYYRPGRVVPPGRTNPLGTRWMGLSQKGYGIHGTTDPSSIGHAKSTGCIRLRNQDVERLFERLRTGDVVEMHAERTPEITQLFAN
jgi:lipoprotein-anchoring transpeptidase ErfK/SrfK